MSDDLDLAIRSAIELGATDDDIAAIPPADLIALHKERKAKQGQRLAAQLGDFDAAERERVSGMGRGEAALRQIAEGVQPGFHAIKGALGGLGEYLGESAANAEARQAGERLPGAAPDLGRSFVENVDRETGAIREADKRYPKQGLGLGLAGGLVGPAGAIGKSAAKVFGMGIAKPALARAASGVALGGLYGAAGAGGRGHETPEVLKSAAAGLGLGAVAHGIGNAARLSGTADEAIQAAERYGARPTVLSPAALGRGMKDGPFEAGGELSGVRPSDANVAALSRRMGEKIAGDVEAREGVAGKRFGEAQTAALEAQPGFEADLRGLASEGEGIAATDYVGNRRASFPANPDMDDMLALLRAPESRATGPNPSRVRAAQALPSRTVTKARTWQEPIEPVEMSPVEPAQEPLGTARTITQGALPRRIVVTGEYPEGPGGVRTTGYRESGHTGNVAHSYAEPLDVGGTRTMREVYQTAVREPPPPKATLAELEKIIDKAQRAYDFNLKHHQFDDKRLLDLAAKARVLRDQLSPDLAQANKEYSVVKGDAERLRAAANQVERDDPRNLGMAIGNLIRQGAGDTATAGARRRDLGVIRKGGVSDMPDRALGEIGPEAPDMYGREIDIPALLAREGDIELGLHKGSGGFRSAVIGNVPAVAARGVYAPLTHERLAAAANALLNAHRVGVTVKKKDEKDWLPRLVSEPR